MKSILVTSLIIALCAVSTGFVFRNRRAADFNLRPDPKPICLPDTPCGWAVYRKDNPHMVEDNIVNHYCLCANTTECQRTRNDLEIHSFILHCRPPGTGLEEE